MREPGITTVAPPAWTPTLPTAGKGDYSRPSNCTRLIALKWIKWTLRRKAD